ncbi:hypothetical protein D3C77_507430 [compost metagenome]
MTTAEKQAFVAAITRKGVSASANDSNTVLAGKIDQIVTGMKSASGSLEFSGSLDQRTISGLAFIPKLIILRVTLERSAYTPNDTNGFNFKAHFIVTSTTPNYSFDGSVNSPIYGTHRISAGVNATFGANGIVLHFTGTNVYPYQTVTYTIYGE